MFNFSSKTLVNKEFKLSDFLKQIHASKEIKKDAQVIKKITFKNVISSQTLNCDEDPKYKNIYIIEIELSDFLIPELFIQELDKNILFHTYFIFRFENKISSMIAFKDITKKVIVDKYYSHNFDEDILHELPIINNVADMYKYLLSYEIKIDSKEVETPDEYISRVKQINKLNFQILKTEKAIIYESQPKKKFEYNARLRKYKQELKDLTDMEVK